MRGFKPRRRNEPREGRRQRPRAFTTDAAQREGQEKCHRATPTRPRHGEAGGSARGKAVEKPGWAPTSRETNVRRCCSGRGENFRFVFFVFSDFCVGLTFYVCSEKLAMFWCESFTLNGCFLFFMNFCKNISCRKNENTSSSCTKLRMIISWQLW